MITRKDNLLKRPWQQKKFEHHRRKVESAMPAIDTNPPPFRSHVVVKLKKQQKEKERCQKIEHENFLLLQKMNYLTRTSRVDNKWKSPLRNVGNKVALYGGAPPRIEDLDFEFEDEINEVKGRRSKCVACTPLKKYEEIKITEERIPWESTKKSFRRSQSVPSRKPVVKQLSTIKIERSSAKTETSSVKTESNSVKTEQKVSVGKSERFSAKQRPQSIILSRGNLTLSLNFPSDTLIKLKEGNKEKCVVRGVCHCRNAPGVKLI